MKEEEGEIFPKTKEAFDEEQIERLGIRMRDEKEEFLAFQET